MSFSGTRPELTVRYFAGARAATGVAEEAAPAGLTVTELLSRLEARHGPRLGKVLAVASVLVNGYNCHDREAALPAGATVDILPPFAGG